jgi:hypothetical protein
MQLLIRQTASSSKRQTIADRLVQGVTPAALTRRSRSASHWQMLSGQENRRRLGVVKWLLLGCLRLPNSRPPSPGLPRQHQPPASINTDAAAYLWDNMMLPLQARSKRMDAAVTSIEIPALLSCLDPQRAFAKLLHVVISFAPCGRPTRLRFTDSARVAAGRNNSFASEPEIRC